MPKDQGEHPDIVPHAFFEAATNLAEEITRRLGKDRMDYLEIKVRNANLPDAKRIVRGAVNSLAGADHLILARNTDVEDILDKLVILVDRKIERLTTKDKGSHR